jgi:hypothetical protein
MKKARISAGLSAYRQIQLTIKITLNPYIKTTASMMELGIRELFKQNSLGTINIVSSVIPLEKY